MEFKTYNIDGDNIYISSPLGLAELNREHRLFDIEKTQLCEDLLKAKIDFDIEMQNMQNNISQEQLIIGAQQERPSEKMNNFYEAFSKIYAYTINFLINLNNLNAPDFYKNKNI